MNEESSRAIEMREKGDVEASEGTRPGPVFTPPVDIFESADAITVLADMPGVQPEHVTVDLNEDVLTITGYCEDGEEEGKAHVVQEYRCGTFQRRFTLSELVDQAGIKATVTDGVLRLELPEADRAKPARIEVRAGK